MLLFNTPLYLVLLLHTQSNILEMYVTNDPESNLTDHLYIAKKSSLNFTILIPGSRRQAYHPDNDTFGIPTLSHLGRNFDLCSALMSSIKPKYPLTNDYFRNQIVQSRALEYVVVPIT